MAEALTSFEQPVRALSAIDEGLNSLWNQIEQGDPKKPLCRTLTANLIAITDSHGEADLRRTISELFEQHPCRAFLLVVEPRPLELEAHLTARVRYRKRDRQTLLEQLDLRGGAEQLAKVPGILRPLIVSDLPVYLYWAMALPRTCLAKIAGIADYNIVNSHLLKDPKEEIGRLGQVVGKEAIDLLSIQLRPWRRALAEAFETFEWDSRTPTRVSIDAGVGNSAANLGGWLATKLAAEINIHTHRDDTPLDELISLSLEHGSVRIIITNEFDARRLRIDVTLADRCLVPSFRVLPRRAISDLLGDAMEL